MSHLKKLFIIGLIAVMLITGLGLAVQTALAMPTIKLARNLSYPTFSIVSVVENDSVTIKTNNLPANDKFDVTMGEIGTKGEGGLKVTTVDSGTGGSVTYTFDIPASLHGSYLIAIRMESPTSGFYAYNWFINSSNGGTAEPTPDKTPSATTPPGYSGYPTFSILAVVRDTSVEVQTKNLPPKDSFVVTMGQIGTKGVDGIEVDTVDSGTGGSKKYTFDIPAALEGSYMISIRMQSPTSGYYAYNWFYNIESGTR